MIFKHTLLLLSISMACTLTLGCGGSSGPSNAYEGNSAEEIAAFKEQMKKEQMEADKEMEGL